MAMSKTLLAVFEAFWAAYPRRPDNPKAAAAQVFERRVREGVDPAAIVAAAGRYAARCTETRLDPKFVPHARTWLSQARYLDYPSEDVPAPAEAIAQPAPEHPLAWLKDHIGEARWASWIQPLAIVGANPPTITAPTQFALDHVKGEWGYLLRRHYGELVWAVQSKD